MEDMEKAAETSLYQSSPRQHYNFVHKWRLGLSLARKCNILRQSAFLILLKMRSIPCLPRRNEMIQVRGIFLAANSEYYGNENLRARIESPL